MKIGLKVGQSYPTVWGGVAKIQSISGDTILSTSGYLYHWTGEFLEPVRKDKEEDTNTINRWIK